MSKVVLKGVIDRVALGVAVILVGAEGEQLIEIPVACLPAGVKEGDLLTVKIESSPNKTRKAKDEVARMIKKLRG